MRPFFVWARKAGRMMQARHVQDWSIVQLPHPDERIGVYTRRGPGNKPCVMISADLGVEIKLSTDLCVLKTPAELAMEALRTYEMDARSVHIADQWKASPC